MLRLTFPDNWRDSNCILVPMHAALVPYVSGALKAYEERFIWSSQADYEQAYNAIAELRAAMQGNDCLKELIESNNRLYRLLDTALNGTNYNVQILLPDGEPTINPPIPDVPPQSTTAPNAMRAQLGRLWHLAENTTTGAVYAAGAGVENAPALEDERPLRDTIRDAQGLLNAGWFGIGGRPATLADIVTALRIGSDTDQGVVNDALQEILGTSSDANSIFNTIRGLFDTAANTTLEGGQLGVLLASSLANAALMAQQAKELQLLNRLLSGTTAEFGAPALTHEAVLFGFPPGGNGDKIPIGELARQSTANTDIMRSNLGAPGEADRVIPLLRSIATTIGTIGSGGGNSSEQLQLILASLESIRLNLQADSPNPTSSMYDLVTNIMWAVRCVCDAVGGENTPDPGGDGPQFVCENAQTEWVRVSGWVELGPVDGDSENQFVAWAADFDFPSGYGVAEKLNYEGRPVYRLQNSQPWWDWCEGWEWTEAAWPYHRSAPRGANPGDAAIVPNQGGDRTVSLSDGWTDAVTTFNPPTDPQWIGFTWYFLPGQTPPLNLWIKSQLGDTQ